MKSIQDSLASWATLVGALVSGVGLIQSQTWLTTVGSFCIAISIVSIAYARRERLVIKSADIRIEGRNIDSLNIANLRRRVNRSLFIQEVHRTVEIEGEDLRITSRCSGYCRADMETVFEFSIDSDNNVPFHVLDCFAFDLLKDPCMQHKIRPILIGSDGSSKKIAVPFLKPLQANQPFAVFLECALPGCMKTGVEYYTSTLSFDQESVARCTVDLKFIGTLPEWMRVYECDVSGSAKLLKDLRPESRSQESTRYADTGDDVGAQSTRIYVFRRT